MTTGTGNITVAASPASARMRPMSDIPTGTAGVVLVIEDEAGTEWEESYCTILSETTFSRDTVINGSNGTSKVNFTAAVLTVFCTMSAAQIAKFASADADVVTELPDLSAVTVPVYVGGVRKIISAENLMLAFGTLTAALPAAGPLTGPDGVPIVQSGGDVLTTLTAIAAAVAILNSTPATAPGAPTIGAATAGNGSATVAFTAPASNGGSAITGYLITASTGQTATVTASPGSITVPNGTATTFTVNAFNVIGTGAPSSASNSVTPSAGITAPGAPTIGAATSGVESASVAFTAPGSTGGSAITGYLITASTGQTASVSASPGVIAMPAGMAATFTVQAVNAVGPSAASAASNSVTPTVATVPSAPTIGTAVAGDGYIDVVFTPGAAGNTATLDYTATLSTGQTATGTVSPVRVTAPNGTAATATVRARNTAGLSAASAASNSVAPTGAPVYILTGPPVSGAFFSEGPVTMTVSGANLYASQGFKIYVKKQSDGVAPATADVKFAWGKSPTVPPFAFADTQIGGFANSVKTASKTNSGLWVNPGDQYYGSFQASTTLYAWTTSAAHVAGESWYLWVRTADGFVKAYDNGTGTPVAWVSN